MNENEANNQPISSEGILMPDDANNQENLGMENHERKNSKNKIVLGAILLVLIIIVTVVAIIMGQPSGSDSSGGDSGGSSDTGKTDDSGSDVTKPLDNTTLSSGTVSTTIDGKTVTYSGAYVVDGIEATIGSGTYESTKDDQVVFLVINGGKLTITGDVTINKTGSENFQGRGDNYSFYGTNSAIVVVGKDSSASINGATITTSVSGANAVVATNSGSVKIINSTISTTKDNSRGLHATYNGTVDANSVSITTQGGSCAALATDRGEGTVVAKKMKLSTAGAGSPLIYSTGAITVSESTGTSTGAQIAVVEGKNSIVLSDCEFTANGVGNRNNIDNAGVMIYQSMSGDASTGTGSFKATDCTFTVLEDSEVYQTTPFFFVTNTTATIELDNVTASFYEDGYFILAAGTNEWGRSGSNGGKVSVTVNNVTLSNTGIGVDEISSVSGL